jgi:hypothetical protein
MKPGNIPGFALFVCPQVCKAGTKKVMGLPGNSKSQMKKKEVAFGQILNAFGEGHNMAFFKFEKLGGNFLSVNVLYQIISRLVKKYSAGKWQDFTISITARTRRNQYVCFD